MRKCVVKTTIPADLRKALASSGKIQQVWDSLTPIAQRDFIFWIDQAKQAQTRARRIEVTISKLQSGKRRPCCVAIVPLSVYAALAKNPKAKAQWSILSADERRDLVRWILADKCNGKTRIVKALNLLLAGKRKP